MTHAEPTPASAPRPSGARRSEGDAGFTLVEMLVAMVIFSILLIIVMATVMSVVRATDNASQFTNENEQARIAVERLTRDMRQASAISSVTLPTTPGGDMGVTFDVDFNGNGVIDSAVADPEILTYRYDSSAQQLTLTANDESGNAVTRPILSNQVTAFSMDFRSSLWQYDANGDGITTWQELDASPVGNNNGVLDAPELAHIDLATVTLTVMDGPHKQTYQTQVGLRNQSQN